MTEVGVAFKVLPEGKDTPPGWKNVTGHLIWDVKMDFTHKARWVLDGHLTPSPIGSTYAGVVSRESVRIMFTYAVLNGLDVFTADIQNAYIQAPSSCKGPNHRNLSFQYCKGHRSMVFGTYPTLVVAIRTYM
jgi:hypothetical protein